MRTRLPPSWPRFFTDPLLESERLLGGNWKIRPAAGLYFAATVLGAFGEDIDAMIGLLDRALALNPSFARGWFRSGGLRLWTGQQDLAIEHVETALRLSPRERID
jgi:tetratricopeptide (TPR) repeat protein